MRDELTRHLYFSEEAVKEEVEQRWTCKQETMMWGFYNHAATKCPRRVYALSFLNRRTEAGWKLELGFASVPRFAVQ